MTRASFHMLDTNMVSYLVSGRSPSARRTYIETEQHSGIVLSAITEAEVLFGLEKKPEATRLRAAFEEFLTAVTVLPWDSTAALAYGKLRARLHVAGKNVALMDLLIAAHAVAAGAVLVSHDKAFQQLSPVLTVVDWAADL